MESIRIKERPLTIEAEPDDKAMMVGQIISTLQTTETNGKVALVGFVCVAISQTRKQNLLPTFSYKKITNGRPKLAKQNSNIFLNQKTSGYYLRVPPVFKRAKNGGIYIIW